MTDSLDPHHQPAAARAHQVAPRQVRVCPGEARATRAIVHAVTQMGHTVVPDAGSAEVLVAPPNPSRSPEEHAGHLMELRRAGGTPRLVWVSHLTAVGPLPPGSDLAFEGRDEEPVDPSGVSHLTAERTLLAARDAEGFQLVILRTGHLFDEDNGPELAALLTSLFEAPALLAGAAQDHPMPFLHREDLAMAVAMAVSEGDWVYHLGPNTCPTLGQLVLGFLGHFPMLNTPGLPRAAEQPDPRRVHWRYPNHRAERELRFQIQRPLPEAAQGLVQWVASQQIQKQLGDTHRPIRWKDRWWRILPEEESADVSAHRVTLHDAEDPTRVHVVRAQDLAPGTTPRPSAHRSLRGLLEALLDAGFSDRWVGLLLDFACQHGLIAGAEPRNERP